MKWRKRETKLQQQHQQMSKIKHNEGIRKAYNETSNVRQKKKKKNVETMKTWKKREKVVWEEIYTSSIGLRTS